MRTAAIAAAFAAFAAWSTGLPSARAAVVLADGDLDAISAGTVGSPGGAAAQATALALGPNGTLTVTFTDALAADQGGAEFAIGTAEALAIGELFAAAGIVAGAATAGGGTAATVLVQATSAASGGTAATAGRAFAGSGPSGSVAYGSATATAITPAAGSGTAASSSAASAVFVISVPTSPRSGLNAAPAATMVAQPLQRTPTPSPAPLR